MLCLLRNSFGQDVRASPTPPPAPSTVVGKCTGSGNVDKILHTTISCLQLSVSQGHYDGCLKALCPCYSEVIEVLGNCNVHFLLVCNFIGGKQQPFGSSCMCYLSFFTALSIEPPVYSGSIYVFLLPVRVLRVQSLWSFLFYTYMQISSFSLGFHIPLFPRKRTIC